MSFMFKATVATACMALLFATSILTRDRADTGWNPQRARSDQSTAKVRASSNKELNRETENACGDKRDSPGFPDCYGAVLKQPDVADGPSAKRLSSSRDARQASGAPAPSDLKNVVVRASRSSHENSANEPNRGKRGSVNCQSTRQWPHGYA